MLLPAGGRTPPRAPARAVRAPARVAARVAVAVAADVASARAAGSAPVPGTARPASGVDSAAAVWAAGHPAVSVLGRAASRPPSITPVGSAGTRASGNLHSGRR